MEKTGVYTASSSVPEIESPQIGEVHDVDNKTRWQDMKHTLTTREGWLGDYVSYS